MALVRSGTGAGEWMHKDEKYFLCIYQSVCEQKVRVLHIVKWLKTDTISFYKSNRLTQGFTKTIGGYLW